jgi:probable addiction module antidote protein
MTETFTHWDVAEHLRSEADIAAYLDAAIAEGDPALIVAALGDIARARNMAALAREVGMSRTGLYNALSGRGNPSFATVLKTARALGLDLKLAPASR